MKARTKPPTQREPQRVSQEVLDSLLGLVRRKFYEGDAASFFKDRWHLLQWALLWPAREFFTPKAVELPNARYEAILKVVIMEAVVHGAEKIKYRPAWLAKVIQSHFAIHGDEYYEEAKAIRTQSERALLALGKLPTKEASAVQDFTTASRLLDGTKPRRKAAQPKPAQGDLFSA
jgi:hypothetical protein